MRLVLSCLIALVVGFVAGVALSERIKNAIWLLLMKLNYGKTPK